ncbi:MAG TPA: PaaI family thioesterase [Hyphomonas sp.]|nr:PaaI family thioesterase [Hyphomonas sp.]MCB9960897.1 PaaI family thioesterase [Hyphomonas sp.]MCB9970188.1 PaaI family thioesterase [Hyphomonas sp.]HPE48282.1 PaaI family thioesterase [Hyphomonas sp.]
MASRISIEEANDFMGIAFETKGPRHVVTHLDDGHAVVRLETDHTHLRPGGYISGPTQMALVDTAAYFSVMSLVGLEPMAVTSNLNMNFLRPCIGKTVVADARMLKIGVALAVMEVDVRVEGAEKAASHAIVTYALPRKETGA